MNERKRKTYSHMYENEENNRVTSIVHRLNLDDNLVASCWLNVGFFFFISKQYHNDYKGKEGKVEILVAIEFQIDSPLIFSIRLCYPSSLARILSLLDFLLK